MSNHFERLQSLLPERVELAANSWYQNSKAVREWLSNLPLANRTLTAQQLLGALRETNEIRIDPLRRMDVLEALIGPVRNIVDSLCSQLQSDTFPMSETRMRISETMLEFERQFTTGYVAVVCDLCGPNGKIPFLRGKTVALALTRAIQHQSARLWIAYQTHCAPQVGVWQSLHDLFLLAISMHCEQKTETDAAMGGAKISPRSAYIQALLHAFAKPYHFVQKENAELRGALPVLAALCDIRPGYAPEGTIAVCCDGDVAPPGPRRGRQVAADSMWSLDVSALLRTFETELARCAADATSIRIKAAGAGDVKLPLELVQRLSKIWRGRSERAFPRNPDNIEMDAVIGLQAVHYVLAGNLDFDTFQNSARQSGIGDEESAGDERHAIFAQAGVSMSPARAQVADCSVGGYRLRFARDQDIRARVGEIVALAPADAQQPAWSVGMLRWLRVDAHGTVEVGIEVLAQDSRAVSVCSLDMKGAGRPAMRGVFIVPAKADETGKVEPYIIVPNLFGRDAIAVEVSQIELSSRHSAARVETISDMRIRASGGLYLGIALPAHATNHASATNAANDSALAKLVQFPQQRQG